MNLNTRLKQIIRTYLVVPPRADYEGLAERCRLLEEQNRFMLYELRRINEALRYHLLGNNPIAEEDQVQTRASFDYQWGDFHAGVAMTDDKVFMSKIKDQICEMTDLPASWFTGKLVVDIGCGAGRYSYGLLALGATVTACDHSPTALQRTAELCKEFSDRLTTQHINLLEWSETDQYDLAFCFGVVHHTGNTYAAIRNAALKVKPGGRLFLMIYGFPENPEDFTEVSSYEELRQKLRPLSFEEKKRVLIEQFGPYLAHGWFDAVSPRINDLLTFPEIVDYLTRLSFRNIKRTMDHHNHHFIADKIFNAS
jgi:SAM-dependent methyltransferase